MLYDVEIETPGGYTLTDLVTGSKQYAQARAYRIARSTRAAVVRIRDQYGRAVGWDM